jgi:4-hydroxy-tetrahydrodipicolinate reductase
MMNIAIIGYGKMGVQIEETAAMRGHQVVAVIDPFTNEISSIYGAPIDKTFETAKNLGQADVAIDFTHPNTAVENIKQLICRHIPSVIGTTGWYERLDEVRQIVEEGGSSLLYAPNFSIGVNLFYRIVSYTAKLVDSFPEYDIAGYEIHHNKKAESPSGTSKTLAERVLAETKRKKTPVWDILNRPPAPEEFHFPSLRVGSVTGTHTLIFDSPADTIEITHNARNRTGFAQGAVLSAEWLLDGEKKGVFTIDDVLEDI